MLSRCNKVVVQALTLHLYDQKGAHLIKTNAEASGPIPFMDTWDALCKTIMSAGQRRGAQMATLGCEHPDLPEFIRVKEEPGRLVNFICLFL